MSRLYRTHLGQIVVHASFPALLPISFDRARGKSDDRQRARLLVEHVVIGPNSSRSFIAVDVWHLTIDQYQV
jgi:hypothetical protein